jgi:hypothetical protein
VTRLIDSFSNRHRVSLAELLSSGFISPSPMEMMKEMDAHVDGYTHTVIQQRESLSTSSDRERGLMSLPVPTA